MFFPRLFLSDSTSPVFVSGSAAVMDASEGEDTTVDGAFLQDDGALTDTAFGLPHAFFLRGLGIAACGGETSDWCFCV
jgi:hypothetical protein